MGDPKHLFFLLFPPATAFLTRTYCSDINIFVDALDVPRTSLTVVCSSSSNHHAALYHSKLSFSLPTGFQVGRGWGLSLTFPFCIRALPKTPQQQGFFPVHHFFFLLKINITGRLPLSPFLNHLQQTVHAFRPHNDDDDDDDAQRLLLFSFFKGPFLPLLDNGTGFPLFFGLLCLAVLQYLKTFFSRLLSCSIDPTLPFAPFRLPPMQGRAGGDAGGEGGGGDGGRCTLVSFFSLRVEVVEVVQTDALLSCIA